MSSRVEYVFHKPLWRKIVPILLLLVAWAIPALLIYATTHRGEGLSASIATLAAQWLIGIGVTIKRTAWVAGTLSLPIVLWWLAAFEKLLIDPEAITRVSLFGNRRSLRWTDMDEVLIEHIEARLEGKSTMRKILTLYAVRKPFMPWRRNLRITNRQFAGYHHVERLASEVAIPAIAARKRHEIESKKKPALFAERRPLDDLWAVILVFVGAALLAIWGTNRFWVGEYASARHYVLGAAILLLLMALRKFWFRQVGIDQENFYVMRREWVMRKVQLSSISDVRVRDNRMRVFAANKNGKVKQVFSTSRFIRNRGVLLRLIREAHDARHLEDATPIVPVHTIRVEPERQEPDAGSGGAAV